MGLTDYLYLPLLSYGKERRRLIKQWFKEHPHGMYAVNCKHRPQLKHDSDLQKLIKQGFLKMVKVHYNRRNHRTFLVRADK